MTLADLIALAAVAAPIAAALSRGPDAARVAAALGASWALTALLPAAGEGAWASAAWPSVIGALLTATVAGLAPRFSARHMAADPHRAVFARRLGLLDAAALATALAADVVTFLIGWTESGALLAALIGHAQGWESARRAARRARATFALGDAAMAAILNDPHVRAALTQQGLPVPADCVAIAAEHNTPTTACACSRRTPFPPAIARS